MRIIEPHIFIFDDFFIDPRGTGADGTARFAVARREARKHIGFKQPCPKRVMLSKKITSHGNCGHILRDGFLLKECLRRARGFLRGIFAMRQGRRAIGKNFFRFIDPFAREILKLFNFIKRQFGEGAQEAAYICVLRVAPELPVIVRRADILRILWLAVEPDRAVGGFAHLGAR